MKNFIVGLLLISLIFPNIGMGCHTGTRFSPFIPEWNKTGQIIPTIPHEFKTHKEFKEEFLKLRCEYNKDFCGNKKMSPKKAFVIIVDDICHLYYVMPTNSKDLDDIGHEFSHCVYGRFHSKPENDWR
jgi:hypothetical protein